MIDLETMTNLDLVIKPHLHDAYVDLSQFGKILVDNTAYTQFMELSLIHDNGKPKHEQLQQMIYMSLRERFP